MNTNTYYPPAPTVMNKRCEDILNELRKADEVITTDNTNKDNTDGDTPAVELTPIEKIRQKLLAVEKNVITEEDITALDITRGELYLYENPQPTTYVYAYEHVQDKRQYVGITTLPEAREKQHRAREKMYFDKHYTDDTKHEFEYKELVDSGKYWEHWIFKMNSGSKYPRLDAKKKENELIHKHNLTDRNNGFNTRK